MNQLYRSFALFGLIFLVALLAICILLIVVKWKIFSKAGKPGWAALIPFYHAYIMSEIAFGNLNYFIAYMVIIVISYIARAISFGASSTLSWLCLIVLYVVYCIKLSKAFGKSGGFTVGLVLLPVIFFPILGFGSDKYIGPQ